MTAGTLKEKEREEGRERGKEGRKRERQIEREREKCLFALCLSPVPTHIGTQQTLLTLVNKYYSSKLR